MKVSDAERAAVEAAGWAGFVAWAQGRAVGGELDPDAAWELFAALAATSEQATDLAALARRFGGAPAQDRLALACTVASVLGPTEWPPSWRRPRRRLVGTIDGLLCSASVEALQVARRLLDAPCRRQDVAHVAALCNLGAAAWAERTAVGADDERAARLAVDLASYASAARDMNGAAGVVLFKALDLRARR